MNLNPLPITLRQLQYVVAVAETLSFREAAERCHVSQPSLSAQIAEVESALGVTLFDRNRRRVLMTAPGTALVKHARDVLRETQELLHHASHLGDPLQGEIRIGVIPTISPYLVPRLAPVFKQTYPDLKALWIEDKTKNLVRSLGTGEIDAALMALEADIGDVDYERVADDAFVLALPKGHPLAKRKRSIRAGDLQGEDVLLLNEGHCFRDQALEYCGSAKLHELEFRATSLSTLSQMVASGAGVTLLPKLVVPVETARADLEIRKLAKPVPKRTIILAWRRGTYLEPTLKQLSATARATF